MCLHYKVLTEQLSLHVGFVCFSNGKVRLILINEVHHQLDMAHDGCSVIQYSRASISTNVICCHFTPTISTSCRILIIIISYKYKSAFSFCCCEYDV